MTEQEAKTKWCPFARVGLTAKGKEDIALHSPAINRTTTGLQEGSRCIGSACMAFRVADKIVSVPTDGGAFHRDVTTKDAGSFCGLAGKP